MCLQVSESLACGSRPGPGGRLSLLSQTRQSVCSGVSRSVRYLAEVAARVAGTKAVSGVLAVVAVMVVAGVASATDPPAWPTAIPKYLDPEASLGLLELLMQYLMPIFLAFSIGVVVCYLVYRWILGFAAGRAR